MDLVWSARAKRDVREIGTYIAKNNRSAAIVMVKRIAATAESLIEFPMMGHAGRVLDTYELLIPATSYILVYQADRRRIRIVAVMHTSREWPDVF